MIIKMIAGISLVFLSVAAFILMYSFEINYAISVPIMLAGIAVSMLLLAETGLVIECLRAKLTDEELEKTKKYKWMIIFGLILAIISPSAIVSLYQYTHFGIYLAVFFTVLIPAVGLLIGGGMMWEKLVEVKIKK